MASISLVSWLWRPTCGLRDVGWGDIGLAVALSLLGVLAVTGLVRPTPPHGGVIAAVALLGMTAPVAVERRLPLIAACAVAAGAVLNELLVGPMVRCAPGLPAVMVIAFFAASRLATPALVGAAALCCVSVVT